MERISLAAAVEGVHAWIAAAEGARSQPGPVPVVVRVDRSAIADAAERRHKELEQLAARMTPPSWLADLRRALVAHLAETDLAAALAQVPDDHAERIETMAAIVARVATVDVPRALDLLGRIPVRSDDGLQRPLAAIVVAAARQRRPDTVSLAERLRDTASDPGVSGDAFVEAALASLPEEPRRANQLLMLVPEDVRALLDPRAGRAVGALARLSGAVDPRALAASWLSSSSSIRSLEFCSELAYAAPELALQAAASVPDGDRLEGTTAALRGQVMASAAGTLAGLQPTRARELLRKAYDLAEGSELAWARTDCLVAVGEALLRLPDPAAPREADRVFDEALSRPDPENPQVRVRTLARAAAAWARAGRHDRAGALLESASEALRQVIRGDQVEDALAELREALTCLPANVRGPVLATLVDTMLRTPMVLAGRPELVVDLLVPAEAADNPRAAATLLAELDDVKRAPLPSGGTSM